MCDPLDDLSRSAILAHASLSGIHLRVRNVLLSLPSVFANNQVVPGTVSLTVVTSTARPGADREALHPRAVQHVRERAKFIKQPSSLITKFFEIFI